MAEHILFKINGPVPGIEIPFTGKPIVKINHPDFHGALYQQVYSFIDQSECLRDSNGNPSNSLQHPIELYKDVDIDTPFFKACCLHKSLIPKITFYFFHTLKGDQHHINFLTIDLDETLILNSTIILYDNSISGSKKDNPYMEKLILNPQKITWNFKRGAPMEADHGITYPS